MQDAGKENLAKKERIDVLIDRKKKNITDLTEKKKMDYTLLNKLQGQITQVNNKLTDLNHRYNLLEQNYKQSEEKCQKLSDNNKVLTEEFERKDKELKNIGAKMNYAIKEKGSLEDKLKENKSYINKLEQRILQDKPGFAKRPTNEASPQKYKAQQYEENSGVDWGHSEMKQIIDNQKYEIKLLTQTLHERETRDSKLKDTVSHDYSHNLRTTLDDENNEVRKTLLSMNDGARAFDRLSYDYQNLLSSFRENQELLAQYKSKEKEQEEAIRDDRVKNFKLNTDFLKKRQESVPDVEKESLHKYIEELNQTIRGLTEENNRLQKGHDGINMKHAVDQTKIFREIDQKNAQIRDLEYDVAQEKRKVEELNKTMETYLEDRKLLLEERSKTRKLSEINDLMNQEINKLKQLMNESEQELEFYKHETEILRKDKDNLRTELEEYVRRNSTIEQSLRQEKAQEFDSVKIAKIMDEVEKIEIEKKTLKDTLKQALQEIEAGKTKEKEYEELVKQKEKQIENLVNSRNMMQNTLGDQVLNRERENKRLKEENAKAREDAKILTEENTFIRDLLRQQEKYIHENSSLNKSKHL